jgi:hypothetical protein
VLVFEVRLSFIVAMSWVVTVSLRLLFQKCSFFRKPILVHQTPFHTTGYVKPNVDLNNITLTLKSEIENLSKIDVVVLSGGTLEEYKEYVSKDFS